MLTRNRNHVGSELRPSKMGSETGKMEVKFECIQCGKCCHNLRLSLSVDEAIRWAEGGNQVQVLCEAMPWPSDPNPADTVLCYKGERAFHAMSGDLPVKVGVTLVAAFDGPCPYLRADMLCGNYEERPSICRIYPAEIVPLLEVKPERKVCPPAAWAEDMPVLTRHGRVVDPDTRSLIEAYRAVTLLDVPAKVSACLQLGIARSALANEGFALHSPDPRRLIDALREGQKAGRDVDHSPSDWAVVTNRASTLDILCDAGAVCGFVEDDSAYIGFFPPEPLPLQ